MTTTQDTAAGQTAASGDDAGARWDADDGSAQRTGTLLAVLVATAPVIPALAALATAMAYSSQVRWWPVDLDILRPYPVLEGTLLVLALWFIYVWYSWQARRATAPNANVREYTILMERTRQVGVRLSYAVQRRPELLDGAGGAGAAVVDAPGYTAYREARAYCDDIGRERCRKGTNWALATGYVNLWTMVHGAEQALLELVPVEAVLAEALYDQLRLKGSTISDRDDWLLKLHLAVHALRPSAERYINPSPLSVYACEHDAAPTAQPGPVLVPVAQPATPEQIEARAVLRTVRRAIDEFRDDRRDKLVRACNHLKVTVFVTGFTAYLLLVSEIGYGVDRQQIHSVVVLSIVGVIVGFFGRLRADSGVESAAEDYGLSATRLRQIPVFSGLAAIGGVLVTAALQANGAIALGAAYTIDFPHLVTAAIFGLAPGLLVDRLQQRTTGQYSRDLQSTQPTTTSPA